MTSPARDRTENGAFGGRSAFVAAVLRRVLGPMVRVGTLGVVLPDGRALEFEGAIPGPRATLVIHRWRAFRRLLGNISIGFAESYADGDWDCDALPQAVEIGALNRSRRGARARPPLALRLLRRIRHIFRRNTRAGSRRNIAAHYDLGNDFYRLWLDPTLTYSSAVFTSGDQSLEHAQLAKYDRLLDLLDPAPGATILEIGCGWGGFTRRAVETRNVHVTAVTVSEAQRDHLTRAIASDGLDDRIEIRLCDYRDLEGTFDHIVSIEMIEAVGERYWPSYFETLHNRLRPGGTAAIQAITIDENLFRDYRLSVDFIQRHIFPGGMLASPEELRRQAELAGLAWSADDGFGDSYARTLAEWRDAFDANAGKVEDLGFDSRFRRLWRLYLAYCEGGFRAGNIDVRQILLKRIV